MLKVAFDLAVLFVTPWMVTYLFVRFVVCPLGRWHLRRNPLPPLNRGDALILARHGQAVQEIGAPWGLPEGTTERDVGVALHIAVERHRDVDWYNDNVRGYNGGFATNVNIAFGFTYGILAFLAGLLRIVMYVDGYLG